MATAGGRLTTSRKRADGADDWRRAALSARRDGIEIGDFREQQEREMEEVTKQPR